MTVDWLPLRPLLDAADRVVLTSHARPDADALGSELALAAILEEMGKTVSIVNPSAAPDNLAFLDPHGRIAVFGRGQGGATGEDFVENHDLHLIVDTSSYPQLGEVAKVFQRTGATRVVIDHHQASDDLEAIGAHVFRDTGSEAAGAMVAEMAEALDLPLPKAAITPLFAAIATDTGWFRHSNTRPSTLRLAARLMELGADPTELYRKLYEEQSIERLRLSGEGRRRMQIACEGKLAFTTVGAAEFASTGGRPPDSEGLANDCLRVGGTEAAFVAVEQPNGKVKLSFRSRGGCDVSALAAQFGGGGHRQASGAMIDGPLENAAETVRDAFESALNCE
ncbi:DHH family phosphoesterase [Alienimonas chondri]|uniref:Bifunctional oligoribonuclease and PAP phosphatase NrnA n=1 Tax=Alienimonas chondri TaxID=2681879 RepID=A0ABX1V7K8_9PLAN|nr:bifunctional oligoribonuclease/PAP phosphatase NrnA [Alienimonas chondri]NNJ24208.1 Bifunctional oligoribonuclease and PAP phosphatase NrnA [Alienimonas chondri]